MKSNDEIAANYEGIKVDGRSEWCPRKGIYKIVSLYKGTCLNKPALMAKTNWKGTSEETYTEQIFEIQLESFILKCTCLERAAFITGRIIGHEVLIENATYNLETIKFVLEWEIMPVNISDEEMIDLINKPLTTDELNELLMVGMIDPDLDEEFGYDDDNDSEFQDID